MDETFTMRGFLIIRTMMLADCDWITAAEAVHSTAIEHPEWDLDQRKTWADWTAQLEGG